MKECIAFQMEDAENALKHINDNADNIIVSDKSDYNYPLYTWDDGYRTLIKCKKCNAFILLQSPDFHSLSMEGLYYQDYFPISSIDEANEINRKYNIHAIEKKFNRRWLSVKNSKCYWINKK